MVEMVVEMVVEMMVVPVLEAYVLEGLAAFVQLVQWANCAS
jgi:hypothetical protein